MEPVLIRDQAREIGQYIAAALFALICVVGSIAAQDEPEARGFFLLVGVPAVLVAFRIARSRVVADESGVHLRGLWKTEDFEWSEIVAFEIRMPVHAGDPEKAVLVDTEGRRFELPGTDVAFGMVRRDRDDLTRDAVATLNALLVERTAS